MKFVPPIGVHPWLNLRTRTYGFHEGTYGSPYGFDLQNHSVLCGSLRVYGSNSNTLCVPPPTFLHLVGLLCRSLSLSFRAFTGPGRSDPGQNGPSFFLESFVAHFVGFLCRALGFSGFSSGSLLVGSRKVLEGAGRAWDFILASKPSSCFMTAI